MQAWLKTTQQQLSRQVQSNKLPHALLFSGVKGAGHEELALWLTQILLCQHYYVDDLNILHACKQCKACKLSASNSYPDHITLSTDKATIGVDEVRKLSQFFEKTAHIGTAKTAWVKQADTMTVSAANALLKTLEEPTVNSFIILTTNSAETLLPTIISRCQQFKIRPPMGENLFAAFSTDDGQQASLQDNQKKSDLFANLSHYSELSDASVANDFQTFRNNIKQYLCYHAHRAELLKALVDNSNAMRWFEKVIVDLTREQWRWSMTKSSGVEINLDAEQLWQIYRLIQTANMKLKTLVQVNRQFLSEKLLVDISRIVYSAGD
ncbi:DNA polymerase III subunit [Cognaticolwellia mytili]|uniref:DNA polymerase III subunit n=1 Tax=Cognaticolwellia mytili TaxID=1888913 RepID=UPI000A174B24|nr:DNA polymerase III subunit [Cognaticolwellia mytili]